MPAEQGQARLQLSAWPLGGHTTRLPQDPPPSMLVSSPSRMPLEQCAGRHTSWSAGIPNRAPVCGVHDRPASHSSFASQSPSSVGQGQSVLQWLGCTLGYTGQTRHSPQLEVPPQSVPPSFASWTPFLHDGGTHTSQLFPMPNCGPLSYP